MPPLPCTPRRVQPMPWAAPSGSGWAGERAGTLPPAPGLAPPAGRGRVPKGWEAHRFQSALAAGNPRASEQASPPLCPLSRACLPGWGSPGSPSKCPRCRASGRRRPDPPCAGRKPEPTGGRGSGRSGWPGVGQAHGGGGPQRQPATPTHHRWLLAARSQEPPQRVCIPARDPGGTGNAPWGRVQALVPLLFSSAPALPGPPSHHPQSGGTGVHPPGPS